MVLDVPLPSTTPSTGAPLSGLPALWPQLYCLLKLLLLDIKGRENLLK